jgi:ABC-type antimicrobial peptide transport system permease subunit
VPRAKGDPSKWPGMILGCGVLGIHKEKDGSLGERPLGLYENWVKLDVLGISPDAASPDVQSDKSERNYWIADDSRTQIWQSDTQSVYVPFDVIQSDLKMEERTVTNVDTGKEEIIPSRTRDLQVAVKPGIPLEAAKKQIELIVEQVQSERAAKDRAAGHEISRSFPISVETWEESQELFINAIEKEKALVTFLFGIVSIVAIFCIFCIFYMIVVEKTRDIGIIKSCGATSTGVAGIFLGYGLAIGIVGASCGFLAGYLIVHNINFLHTEMGKILGIQIWNPEVYAFDTIPNTMDPFEVAIIVLVAIMSSVLGSLIPAIVAARKNPIECLRFE